MSSFKTRKLEVEPMWEKNVGKVIFIRHIDMIQFLTSQICHTCKFGKDFLCRTGLMRLLIDSDYIEYRIEFLVAFTVLEI